MDEIVDWILKRRDTRTNSIPAWVFHYAEEYQESGVGGEIIIYWMRKTKSREFSKKIKEKVSELQ